jgi:hypothetical protein
LNPFSLNKWITAPISIPFRIGVRAYETLAGFDLMNWWSQRRAARWISITDDANRR